MAELSLTQKKCVACEGGTPTLTMAEVGKYKAPLKQPWEVVMDENHKDAAKKIKREFKFKDFKEAMTFINKIAAIAEEEQHHPDIYIFYNRTQIELWTHAIGGLSENDFIMAAKIEQLL